MVKIDKGQAGVGTAKHFWAYARGGKQFGTCQTELFGQRQQCLGIGNGNQFGGEIESLFHEFVVLATGRK